MNPLPRVCGIAFRPAGTVVEVDPLALELAAGDEIVVETERGESIARVVTPPGPAGEIFLPEQKRPKVLRKATGEDLSARQHALERGDEALAIAWRRANERNLAMKMVAVEWDLACSHATVYFAADERIDFRALVKDLAGDLRARVEMRQIGVRDSAKMIGGVGPCGRELCCSSFLHEFAPVSIKMAKDQGLALNPSKISGMCGRLMCCLEYEHEAYAESQKGLPKVGKSVVTPKGRGRVVSIEILPRKARVLLDSTQTIELFDAGDCRREP